jgi:hypothetical protein
MIEGGNRSAVLVQTSRRDEQRAQWRALIAAQHVAQHVGGSVVCQPSYMPHILDEPIGGDGPAASASPLAERVRLLEDSLWLVLAALEQSDDLTWRSKTS